MRRLLLAVLVLALLAAVTAPTVLAKPKISGYTEKVDVKKVSKGYLTVEVTSSFKISGFEGDELQMPITAPYYTKKAKVEVKAASVKVGGEELAKGAEVKKIGDALYVIVKLSRPLAGKEAEVTVTTTGVIKSTAKLYVTREYKYYKDYSKAKGRVMYYELKNLWDYKIGSPVKIIVTSPKGWRILAAMSSISSKTRYMEMTVTNYPDYSEVDFIYLDTKKMIPKSLSPGASFAVEVYFIPKEDYTNPYVMAWGALLLILAAVSAYAYRDVYKYVTRKISVTEKVK